MACEYCEEGRVLGKSKSELEGADAEIDRNELVISGWYDSYVGIVPLRIPINFCPMCGSDLNGDAS